MGCKAALLMVVGQVIEFAVVGLFVGGMSRLIKPEQHHLSPLMTLSLGLAGSLAGALVANVLGTGPFFELNLAGLFIASTGAALLIALPNTIASQHTRSVTNLLNPTSYVSRKPKAE